MEGTFSVANEVDSGRSVVSVAGEVDVATAPDLRSRLDEAVDRGGLVITDLLGVTFIDSTALGVLIGSLKRAQASGGELRLVVADTRILKIFEITGLTNLFTIFPTLDAAMA